MKRMDRIDRTRCWIDLFECDYFLGRMQRLFGPVELHRLSAGSVIVGPDASVVLKAKRGRREVTVHLHANHLVPDLAASLGGTKIEQALVNCSDRKTLLRCGRVGAANHNGHQ